MLTDNVEKTMQLKRVGCEDGLFPHFAELYSEMFHLAKYTATEKTLDAVLCRNVTATTDVENINGTVGTDWRDFVFPCPCQQDDLSADG